MFFQSLSSNYVYDSISILQIMYDYLKLFNKIWLAHFKNKF